MHTLFHITSSIPTKSNLYLANSLAAAVSEPAPYRLLTFQVPNAMPLFRCLVCTKVYIQFQGFLCKPFVTRYVFMVRSCWHLAHPPSCRSTPCRLSVTAYSIYSHLPCICNLWTCHAVFAVHSFSFLTKCVCK